MRLSCHSAPLSGIDHLGCDPRIWQLAAVSGGPRAVRQLPKLSRVLHDGLAHVRGNSTDPLALGSGLERTDLRIPIIGGIPRRETHGVAGIYPWHSLVWRTGATTDRSIVRRARRP